VGGGGEVLAEVAEANLDGAEELAIGGVHQGLGHLLQQGSGEGLELAQEAWAALGRGSVDFSGRRRGRSGGG
jgi:hypothetical protein